MSTFRRRGCFDSSSATPSTAARARGVVVRAVMDRARLFLARQRVAVSPTTKMIVVGAERHPRLVHARRRARRRQIRDDVPSGLRLALHGGANRDGRGRNREAGHVRVAGIEFLLHGLEIFAGGREDRAAGVTADARGDDARPGQGRVEAHGNGLAGVGRARAGDDEHGLGAALPRRHRLVAKVGIARQDRARLLIGVFWKVAQHEHDLVFHVEADVAVVAEILRFGHDEAISGEHDRTGDIGVVGERQRLHVRGRDEGPRLGAGAQDGEGRARVLRAGREQERLIEVLLSRQRLRADPRQLARDVVGRQPLAVGPGKPPVELSRWPAFRHGFWFSSARTRRT